MGKNNLRNMAEWEKQRRDARHALRMAIPNPACRIVEHETRPEDIAFNEARRKYEREYPW